MCMWRSVCEKARVNCLPMTKNILFLDSILNLNLNLKDIDNDYGGASITIIYVFQIQIYVFRDIDSMFSMSSMFPGMIHWIILLFSFRISTDDRRRSKIQFSLRTSFRSYVVLEVTTILLDGSTLNIYWIQSSPLCSQMQLYANLNY